MPLSLEVKTARRIRDAAAKYLEHADPKWNDKPKSARALVALEKLKKAVKEVDRDFSSLSVF